MADNNWEPWGGLGNRYRDSAPRKILALDGGGIRGLITLQVLAKLEAEIGKYSRNGARFRLCQFFDYIGGTSTGAIIAAALAIGMSVQEVMQFYDEFGREAFTKRRWYERWKSLYGGGNLQQKLMEVYGSKTDLVPEMPGDTPDPDRKHLKTLLLVVTKNSTTDSAWPLSSNPSAKYNAASRRDCNLRIPLWQLVRASTAAPVYFPPEVIKWDPHDDAKDFVFVDGGTTSYNCPAFLMYRMATEPAYHLGWAQGENQLLVVSIGTGFAPVAGSVADDPETNAVSAAVGTLQGLMSQALFDQDVNCRTVGRCSFGDKLDREVDDLIPRENGNPVPLSRDLGKAFLYTRYNVELTDKGLAALGVTGIDARKVNALDSTDHMNDLVKIGEALAKKVSIEQLGSFVQARIP